MCSSLFSVETEVRNMLQALSPFNVGMEVPSVLRDLLSFMANMLSKALDGNPTDKGRESLQFLVSSLVVQR